MIPSTQNGTTGELVWSFADGTLTVSGCGDMPDYYAYGESPWAYFRDNITAVRIGEGVTKIGENAFDSCSNLTSVALPDSVTRIGKWAFFGCHSLTTLTLPGSVTRIGWSAFYSCHNLMDIMVEKGNPVFSSVDGVLFNNAGTVLVRSPEGKTGHYNVPNHVTWIGEWAFTRCRRLTAVTLSSSVKWIGDRAFEGCRRLTTVTLSNRVKWIGDRAFEGCRSLTDMTVGWTTPLSIGNNRFEGVSLTSCTLHVPAGTKALYQATAGWKKFGSIAE